MIICMFIRLQNLKFLIAAILFASFILNAVNYWTSAFICFSFFSLNLEIIDYHCLLCNFLDVDGHVSAQFTTQLELRNEDYHLCSIILLRLPNLFLNSWKIFPEEKCFLILIQMIVNAMISNSLRFCDLDYLDLLS